MTVILVGVKRYLIILICISLMTDGAEYIFMCLLVICRSYLENLSSSPLPVSKVVYLSFCR